MGVAENEIKINNLQFEIERRVIHFSTKTSMPDKTQLGFNGDPNTINTPNTNGEKLIYNCPVNTRYSQLNPDNDDEVLQEWVKVINTQTTKKWAKAISNSIDVTKYITVLDFNDFSINEDNSWECEVIHSLNTFDYMVLITHFKGSDKEDIDSYIVPGYETNAQIERFFDKIIIKITDTINIEEDDIFRVLIVAF